jgi:hypothetical protein
VLLDEAEEIPLVWTHSQQGLDGALQLQQRERRRHQLEGKKTVFDLAAQPADGDSNEARLDQRAQQEAPARA